jgi:predicted ATPase
VLELQRVVDDDPELLYWRQGRSLPYGDGLTYWALAEMAKAQAGVLESDSPEDTERKLAEAVAALGLGERVLESLRSLVVGVTELEGRGDRSEHFAAWRQFFESLAEQRATVLVFEDLHWADDDLLDFVDHLVDWSAGVPLLVVCTARPELLERRPGWGGGKPNALTLSISPLSEEETARLLASLLDRALLRAGGRLRRDRRGSRRGLREAQGGRGVRGGGRSPGADRQLGLALPVFAQLGATGWAAEGEALLAASA